MEIKSINEEILATKILNELKYNKRMFYNWPIWFGGDKEENIREVLVSEISNIKEELLKGILNPKLEEIEAIPMYKKISVQNIKESLLNELRKHSINGFEFITEYIFLIIEKYNNLKEVREFLATLNNSEEKNNESIDGVLPIGFLPSNILSNLYLLELDQKIKEEFYPVNYSRYVDDIVFLIKTDISENYLSSELPEVERIKSKLSLIKSSLKNSVELNEEKTLFFIVNKQW